MKAGHQVAVCIRTAFSRSVWTQLSHRRYSTLRFVTSHPVLHCTRQSIKPVICMSSARNMMTTPEIIRHDGEEKLSINWGDKESAEYSYVWLRDSCPCAQCYQPASKARLLRMQDLPTDCKPSDIQVKDAEKKLKIIWPDGHVSDYQQDWLRERGYSVSNLQRQQRYWPLPMKTWGNEFQIPSDSFDNLLKDDRALYNWICSLEQFGLFLVTGAPQESGQLHKLAERVAFLRVTNYGVQFTVKAKLNPSNAAYTSASLGLHTDMPYYYYTPGLQMLHCIKQVPTRGGENQFADGFHAAEVVKRLRPDYYHILTTVPVEFYDVGTDYYKFYKFSRKPVICFDLDGNMCQINYNNQVRDYFSHLPPKQLTELFKAMKFFDDILYKPENHVQIKLRDGDIACFHNYRVLHGREGYQVEGCGGDRHLEGGYIDWDELNSRRRVLQDELHL